MPCFRSCLGVYHDHARNVSLMNCKTFHFLKTLYFSIYFFIFHLVSIFFFKLILFYTPTKQQKSSDFLCFRGNKKRSMVWKLSISKQNRKLMWINYSDLRNFLGVTLRTVWERFCFAVKFLGKHWRQVRRNRLNMFHKHRRTIKIHSKPSVIDSYFS